MVPVSYVVGIDVVYGRVPLPPLHMILPISSTNMIGELEGVPNTPTQGVSHVGSI